MREVVVPVSRKNTAKGKEIDVWGEMIIGTIPSFTTVVTSKYHH